MRDPSNRTITIASGRTALVGRTTAIGGSGGTPAWVANAGAAVDKVVGIPGTAGFGGGLTAFSGWAVAPDQKMYMSLAGGHGDGYDNRVSALDPLVDAPGWTVLMPASDPSAWVANAVRYTDNKPSSRHDYQMPQVVMNHIVHPGGRFLAGGVITITKTEAFNLATNQWEAPNWIGDVPGLNGGGNIGYDGKFRAAVMNFILDETNRVWLANPNNGIAGTIRHPWATDVARQQMFGFAYGDGEGSGFAGANAQVYRNGGVAAVTIAASAALDQFNADKPQYAGFDYDPVNDFYLFADLNNGRFYKVVFGTGTTCTISLYAPNTSAVTLPANPLTCRMRYVPQIKGFVFAPETGNVLFLKTSN